ncbi:hypothetical protein G3O08_11590 [Cryomorpha ignava]|uniref:Uncharacterized protein n=1 Tax=Cryomorpha ignava TaxID=101383 RepID=A0A7K3WRN5_9FLAO|nr:hypothetical protein [Cryomorpha ignava]NEN24144.1 hypothetical protein [Cryomorpha ignava]
MKNFLFCLLVIAAFIRCEGVKEKSPDSQNINSSPNNQIYSDEFVRNIAFNSRSFHDSITNIRTVSLFLNFDSLVERTIYISIDTVSGQIINLKIVEDRFDQYTLYFSDNYSKLDSGYFDFPSKE